MNFFFVCSVLAFLGQHADKHSLVSDHTIPIDSETKELTVPCWAVSHQGLTIRPTDEPDFKQRLIDYSVTDIVLRSNSSGFYSASHSNGFTDDPIQVKLLRIHFSGDSFKAAKLCPLDSTTLRWRCKTKWQASKGRHRSVKFRTLMAFSGRFSMAVSMQSYVVLFRLDVLPIIFVAV